MKKHSFIQVEFNSSVKLKPAEIKKIDKWLQMGSEALEKLLKSHQLIHPTWLKQTNSLRVSILLCGESKIKKLNFDYRQKNKVTDVLSFPSFSSLRTCKSKLEFTAPDLFIGDLAICHQRTIQQAKEYDISYWDEFIHLYMHGIIHLLGYDHEVSVKEEKLMEELENEALNIFSKIKKKGP